MQKAAGHLQGVGTELMINRDCSGREHVLQKEQKCTHPPSACSTFQECICVMDHRAVILLKSGNMQRKARMELWLKFHPLHHMLPGSPTFQVLLDSPIGSFTFCFGKHFLLFTGTAAVLSALAAGASVLFTNDMVGSKPSLLLCGFLGRFYLEVVSPSCSVVLSEIHSFPAGELSWNASNHQ